MEMGGEHDPGSTPISGIGQGALLQVPIPRGRQRALWRDVFILPVAGKLLH